VSTPSVPSARLRARADRLRHRAGLERAVDRARDAPARYARPSHPAHTRLVRRRHGRGWAFARWARLRLPAPRDRSREVLPPALARSRAQAEEHTSELQSRENLVCRLLLEKKKLAEVTHHTRP